MNNLVDSVAKHHRAILSAVLHKYGPKIGGSIQLTATDLDSIHGLQLMMQATNGCLTLWLATEGDAKAILQEHAT